MHPKFSVVIPTFRRLDTLPEVLDALERQADPPPFEVVVIDDGSNDGTAEWLRERRFEVPARVLVQENRGPAAARNLGVAEARGERVAFLGDDTVPDPGWLAAHQRAWEKRAAETLEPLGVIGHTRWHRRMRLTPFLRYINDYGLQFGYALIDDREHVPFNFLYTSNLSLPRELLVEEPFDLRFPDPAWEDIELGYRLERRGLRLVYEPCASTSHDHPTNLARFAERQEKAGYSAVVFHALHQELGPFLGLGPAGPPPLPGEPRHRLRERLARILEPLPVRWPGLWEEVLRYHYVRGLHRGWRDRARLLEGETS